MALPYVQKLLSAKKTFALSGYNLICSGNFAEFLLAETLGNREAPPPNLRAAFGGFPKFFRTRKYPFCPFEYERNYFFRGGISLKITLVRF